MHVEVDAKEVLSVLQRAIDAFARPRQALAAAIKELDQRVRGTFRTQSDPWGSPWPELKDSTLDQRIRRGGTSLAILNDAGVMFRSLNSEVTTELEARLTIGGEGRFPGVHQFGNPDNTWNGAFAPIPARPMFPVRPGGRTDLPTDWARAVMAPFDALIQEAIA